MSGVSLGLEANVPLDASTSAPKPSAPNAVPEKAAALLKELLSAAGAPDARMKRVERTLERQTRVMYDLARADLAHAHDMYCDAGDAVLDRFDAKLSESENLSRMQAELSAQLPRARELGCLNHIENDQVFSVDVAVDELEEGRRQSFEEAARKAVKDGRAERFLTPPSHPDAYHFEFRRE